MKGLLLVIATSIFLTACASNQPAQPLGQYCYTDQEIVVRNGENVESQSVIRCSDRPKVNHVTRSAGVASECRSYRHVIRQNGVNRHVKGFLCKFPDGTWEPVNGVFAY
jgi:hypothetical protein